MGVPRFSTALAELAGLPVDRLPETEEEAQRAYWALFGTNLPHSISSEVDSSSHQYNENVPLLLRDGEGNTATDLTVDEREHILLDFHGFSSSLSGIDDKRHKFSKDALAKHPNSDNDHYFYYLSQLEHELRAIPAEEKQAYLKALARNPTHVQEQRILFLRAQQFNVPAAARLVVDHWAMKETLFGAASLARPIVWSDLDADDVECLESGSLQVSPTCDVAGRTVLWSSPANLRYKSMLNLKRALWYTVMSALARSTEMQTKGVVMVAYNYSKTTASLDFIKEMRLVRAALPYRTVGFHFCFSEPCLRPRLLGMGVFFSTHANRLRGRHHFGKPQEATFRLQSYGIPTQHSPLQVGGKWSTDQHLFWLAMLRHQENTVDRKDSRDVLSKADDSTEPHRFDVLFGKTKQARTHTGNVRCLGLVKMHAARYEAANKQQKTEIANEIVSMIYESQGRFLTLNRRTGTWVPVDHEAAREKVSHFFRSLRYPSKDGTTTTAIKDDKF